MYIFPACAHQTHGESLLQVLKYELPRCEILSTLVGYRLYEVGLYDNIFIVIMIIFKALFFTRQTNHPGQKSALGTRLYWVPFLSILCS